GPFGRRRFSSQRLQHPLFLDALQAPLQKIELQRLLADFTFQLGDPPFGPALLPVARKYIARPLAALTPPAEQRDGVYLQPPRHLAGRSPLLQPPHCSQLEALGENPYPHPHDSTR